MSLRLGHAVSRVKKDAEVGATGVSDALSQTFGGTSTAMSALLEDKANGTTRGAISADLRLPVCISPPPCWPLPSQIATETP